MQLHSTERCWPWLFVALVTTTTSAADHDSAEGVAFFERHIRPVLAGRCYSCHSARNRKREGGLQLDSRAGWSAGGDHGSAVVPGNVDESRLIQAIRFTDPDLKMPPDQALPPDTIARFEQWVRMGAPDPREEVVPELPGRGDPSDPVAGREHWSFRPLAIQQLPAVKRSAWPRSGLDTFILAQLEEANLQPAADAERHVLVRRIFLQLTGLPPTAEQLHSLSRDDRPDFFQRLVDELLHAPQFGERWGRHWLDLARYADSNGLDENFLFREAWRYRNWVIAAINADLPFDRFVQEQIAGDLLPQDSIDQRDRQRIAAGFLVIGPKVLLGNNDSNQRLEVADEQLDTIGRALLGQTLGCARCHDHKFDPIPTADYYAMAGILTSTRVMERRFMLNEQRVMERLVGLGSDGEALDDAYESYRREQPKVKERQKHSQSALQLLQNEDVLALQELIARQPGAVEPIAADASQFMDQRIAAQQRLLASLNATLANPPEIPPRAMVPCDREQPADEAIRLAGQFDRLGARVPRGFLRVIGDTTAEIPAGHSGRLQLAYWLTDGNEGAGQLVARVLVNRVWQHLIGRGIVRTVDNFGRTGEAPSHPELLDYLARRFIESGWSIKALVREIVLSRTFAMSSRQDAAGQELDPENRLLWRANRVRLEPEVLRDAMLLAAGELDLRPMRSSVWYLGDQATAVGDNKVRRRTDFPCRSVYLPVIRNDLPELFTAFDFADPHATTGLRPDTLVATQGLFILNDDSVMAAAEATARRLFAEDLAVDQGAVDPDWRAERIVEKVWNAPATVADIRELVTFVAEMRSRLSDENDPAAELHAWALACHALFASSRFQILE